MYHSFYKEWNRKRLAASILSRCREKNKKCFKSFLWDLNDAIIKRKPDNIWKCRRKEENMEIIASILLIVIVYCLCKSTDWKFDRRIPPNGYKTDYGAMNTDLASGKSKTEVKQKFNRGGYDIPDKK